ncbi:hypothetical protein NVP1081O_132 [Vibrio phage 1.081.O._10N.286.52.C2]|nr:hypothetical protein NVP1081O_132 [Vibrio phage 1.081.O._10N.286.52.C2]
MSTTIVNVTAAIELTSKFLVKDGRIEGRFYNSRLGHENGEVGLTQPIQSYKVVDSKVYAETTCCVFHLRNLSANQLNEFNSNNVFVHVKKKDPKGDELIRSALFASFEV